jgi:hypothetical protein
VATVGTSNSDHTISLRMQHVVKKHNNRTPLHGGQIACNPKPALWPRGEPKSTQVDTIRPAAGELHSITNCRNAACSSGFVKGDPRGCVLRYLCMSGSMQKQVTRGWAPGIVTVRQGMTVLSDATGFLRFCRMLEHDTMNCGVTKWFMV